MKHLANVLRQAGKLAQAYRTPDGTRLLILPYGGRVLGLFSARDNRNFYWTHPALESVKTARQFYGGCQWHNSGGQRTWLAPEVDLFFPDFPKLDKYFQQRSLDPGSYKVINSKDRLRLVNRFTVHLSRPGRSLRLKITKAFGPAANPLRHERGLNYKQVAYAGYTLDTSLELVGTSLPGRDRVGLWNLIQMPHGGDMLIPTFGRAEPHHVFSTLGAIPPKDLITKDRLIRYRMRQKGEHKISIRAVSVCNRVGYVYRMGDEWALIIHNFTVNPSGEYVDVPWNDPDYSGFAVQACNVNSQLGAFSELEYHAPAIGYGTGAVHCNDAAQVWAFRGSKTEIGGIARILLTPAPWGEGKA
jgi:hypothetical protein